MKKLIICSISIILCSCTKNEYFPASVNNQVNTLQVGLPQKIAYFEKYGDISLAEDSIVSFYTNFGFMSVYKLEQLNADTLPQVYLLYSEDPAIIERYSKQEFDKKLAEYKSRDGNMVIACVNTGTTCAIVRDFLDKPVIIEAP